MLSVPILMVSWKTSSLFLRDLCRFLLEAVPSWSMIAAAVGARARRKLDYSLALLAFLLALYLTASWTGLQHLAMHSGPASGTRDILLAEAYRLMRLVSPVVALVLFAGKAPSVFWTTGSR